MAESVVWVPLEGREIPVLDCASLAIFKAFFDRTKDRAELVGEDDPAVERLESLIPLDVGNGRGLRR